MHRWRPIAVGTSTAAMLALFTFTLVARQEAGVSAEGRAGSATSPAFEQAPPPPPAMTTVPAGTKIVIRLEEPLSTKRISSGGRFAGYLSAPLWIDDEYLAPSRCKVIGQLIRAERNGRMKEHAKLKMVLRKLFINGKGYDLETEPLTLVVRSTTKKDAAVLARDAALGTLPKTGIARGAEIGYFLETNGSPVVSGPRSIVTFTLTNPLALPVIRKKINLHPAGGI
jgi:hypothetical protein